MQRQLSDERLRADDPTTWRKTTSGSRRLVAENRSSQDQGNNICATKPDDNADGFVDIDPIDSDNDFDMNINEEDELVDVVETDVADGSGSARDLRFCQMHAQSFIVANHDALTMESASVFYSDELPPIPPSKTNGRNAALVVRAPPNWESHHLMRSKQSERSFGYYDVNMQDVEIASLTSSASISSLVLPHSRMRPVSSSVSQHQFMLSSNSPYDSGSNKTSHRLSSATTTDGRSISEVDAFDSLSANSSFSTGASASGTARDNVRECLEKEPHERSDDDVEVLLDFIQRLPAFANMTQSVRRALCAAMVFAAVKEVGTIVMHDGEELDSWSVLINGHVEIEYNQSESNETDNNDEPLLHRAELHVGDSFGVIEPTMERLYHQGTMRTLCDDCQFVCVEQAKFCAILCQGKEYTSAFEKQGRTVMVIEHRLIDAASQRRGPVVIKATAQQLIEHLMADDVGSSSTTNSSNSSQQPKTADPTYTDDFLLTYRIFLKSPLEISQRLMNWFSTDTTLRDKVVRAVLVWINQHFVDFELDPKLMLFLEEFISALAADERTTQLRLMNIACNVKGRQRMITLTRSRRDETLNFSVLGGWERGCGVYICHVADNCKAMQAGLRRGDQIMKVNGIPFQEITHEKALEVLRTATHLAITVQSNLFGFREMINGPPSTASALVKKPPAVMPKNPLGESSKSSFNGSRTATAAATAVECAEKAGGEHLSVYGVPIVASVDGGAVYPSSTTNAAAICSSPPVAPSGFDTLNTKRKIVKAFMRMHWRNAGDAGKPSDADFVSSSSSVISSSNTNSSLCCPTDALNLEVSAAAAGAKSKFYSHVTTTISNGTNCKNVFFPCDDDSSSKQRAETTKLEQKITKKLTNGAAVGQRLYHCLSTPDLRATLAELDSKKQPKVEPAVVGANKLSKLREEANAVATNLQTSYNNAASGGSCDAGDADHHVIKLFMPNQTYKYVLITNKMTARQVIMAGLHEFQLLTTTTTLNDYSLYQVSVVAGGVTRQRRLADTLQDLADSLPLNARYYLKNNLSTNSTTSNLVPDAVAHDIWKESQVEFLQLNMLEAAAQLTMQDFSVFRKIEPTEYVDELWPVQKRLPHLIQSSQNQQSKREKSEIVSSTVVESDAVVVTKTNLAIFTELSNRQMFWVVNEVCRHRDSPARRARVLKNFVKLAQYCFAIRNFNSCFAIVFGLGHAAVSRLKSSWERVPQKHVKQLRALESLMDPSRNMSKYRQLLARYQHSPPLIPFYPIVKKDLTFLNEGNTTFETIQQQHPLPADDTENSGSSDLLFLVNFEKLRMFAREIRQLKHYASVAYNVDDILSSTYFADIIDGTASGTALLRRRTRPDAAVLQANNENLISRQLLLPANKAKQLLALNLAGSFTTAPLTPNSNGKATCSQQSEAGDVVAIAAAVKPQSITSLFSRSSATTILSSSLKKLYENRQMMRRVKLYLSELEIVQKEDQLHALSLLCEPAVGSSNSSAASAAAASRAAAAADSAKLKAATLGHNGKTASAAGAADTLRVQTSGNKQAAQSNASKLSATVSVIKPTTRNTTVSFVRCRPNASNNKPSQLTQQQQLPTAGTCSSLPRAHGQHQQAKFGIDTATQHAAAKPHTRVVQQPSRLQPGLPIAAALGLPKFGQQSPHAVQKLLSLAEKGARPHQMPKLHANNSNAAVNAARFRHFNAIQSSSYYPATGFPADATNYYSSSVGNNGVNYVYGGPPPNSQRLLPALRRNLIDKPVNLPTKSPSVSSSSHLSCSSSSATNASALVPPSPSSSYAAANDENAYQRYYFTPVVVQQQATSSSNSVVSSSNSSSATTAAGAHDLRAHPVQITSVVDQRSMNAATINDEQVAVLRPRQSTKNTNNKFQPPRPPPIEPCNTSLTSQESVPDSGFALHVSGSDSIHSTLSDFCAGNRRHNAISAASLNDSTFSPSIDESLNNCSLSDNSPGSYTRRQPPVQSYDENLNEESQFVHHSMTYERGGCGGGDGTLTNSNRQRASRSIDSNSHKQQQQQQTVANSAKQHKNDDAASEAAFALSRC